MPATTTILSPKKVNEHNTKLQHQQRKRPRIQQDKIEEEHENNCFKPIISRKPFENCYSPKRDTTKSIKKSIWNTNKNHPFQQINHPVHALYLREITTTRTTTQRYNRIKQILQTQPKRNSSSSSSQTSIVWKQTYIRAISFETLDTSWNDGILSFDRTGSHMIGIGSDCCSASYNHTNGYDDEEVLKENLMLRFYGIPSPSRLNLVQKKKKQRLPISTTTSPLLFAIPLFSWRVPQEDSLENRFSSSGGTAATNFPFQMLTSSNGVLGIAILHHTFSCNNTEDEEALSTLLLFPLPSSITPNMNRSSNLITSYQCSNIRFGTNCKSSTILNLLWPIHCIPSLDEDDTTYYTWTNHGYLFWNDEDDGFRLTWIDTFWKEEQQKKKIKIASTNNILKERNASTFFSYEETNTIWERIQSFPSGKRNKESKQQPNTLLQEGDLYIAHEAYLQMNALLYDIALHHNNLFPPQQSDDDTTTTSTTYHFTLPEYSYNIISMLDQGTQAVIVLVFSNPKKSTKRQPVASFGVLLNINIIQKTYHELQWVQHPTSTNLNHWCQLLCLHYRKKDLDLSPHDCCSTREEEDGILLYYPQCDYIQNKALTNGKPISLIDCRDAPIQIYYKS